MSEWLISVLKSTIEYQEIVVKGFFSAKIFLALGTVFFTCLQGYGAWKQCRTIWQKRSGKGVSVMMILFSFYYFVAFIFYGLSNASVVMVFNGLLSLIFLPSVIGIWRFQGFKILEWTYSLVFAATIPTMVLVNDKDSFLLILLAIALGTMISQTVEAYKAWKKGDPGAIEPKFLAAFLFANIFWFFYALSIGNWVLKIFNSLSFTNLSIALIFWWLAKKKADRKTQL